MRVACQLSHFSGRSCCTTMLNGVMLLFMPFKSMV